MHDLPATEFKETSKIKEAQTCNVHLMNMKRNLMHNLPANEFKETSKIKEDVY
jgi:hypothetical protein